MLEWVMIVVLEVVALYVVEVKIYISSKYCLTEHIWIRFSVYRVNLE